MKVENRVYFVEKIVFFDQLVIFLDSTFASVLQRVYQNDGALINPFQYVCLKTYVLVV